MPSPRYGHPRFDRTHISLKPLKTTTSLSLDFWAEWCGPCKAYGPVYERVSEKYPDVVFGKIDTEDQQELAGMFGIRSIPTTIVFKEGIGVFMQPGALPEEALQDLVEKIKEIDMDEVRAEMAEKEANES